MSRRAIAILYPLATVPLLFAAGCTVLGVIAGKALPPPTIPPAYADLHGQSVAVMTWADDAIMIDFPDVRLDLAGSIQMKLQQAQQAKVKELKDMTFATTAAAVVRWQNNHPENDTLPLPQVAPKLNASRVIYVELSNLQTRSDASVELYRGTATATLQVVEVVPGVAQGKVAYEESGITVVFPPKAREEGTPDGSDFAIYRGTVDALAGELAKRFVPHEEEQ